MKFEQSISKELSIRSAYATGFSEKSTKLMIALNNALLSGDPKEVHKVAENAEQIKELQFLIEDDLDVLKPYISYSIASYSDTAKKNGLPKDIAESIKRKYYIKIAHLIAKMSLFQLALLSLKN